MLKKSLSKFGKSVKNCKLQKQFLTVLPLQQFFCDANFKRNAN